MKCPNCGEEMLPGYVMLMGGSALRWYDQDEKQHRILGELGGQSLTVPKMTNEYLSAHRCYGCNRFLMSMEVSPGGYNRAALDKAK
jgi:hypothetical protein